MIFDKTTMNENSTKLNQKHTIFQLFYFIDYFFIDYFHINLEYN